MSITCLLSRLRLPSCSLAVFKSAFLFLFLFFSNSASAADYSWTVPYVSGSFSSPSLACEAYSNFRSVPGVKTWAVTATGVVSSRSCKVYSSGSLYWSDTVSRSGTSCPSGSTYNETTGSCDSPPPDCKVGDLFPSKGSVANVITSADGRNYVPSVPVGSCFNRCTYSADSGVRPSSCYGTKGGAGFCNYILKGTGVACSVESYTFAQSGPQLNPSDTAGVPDSDPSDPLCPSGWAVSAGTCYKLPPKPCDPSTGAVCAPGTTDPNAKPPAPGAGGTAGTPSEGTSGRDESSDGADADLEEIKKTEAEPCKPKSDGSGCGGSTVKGEQCDKDIVCTGDAVQCAILRQSKKNACDSEYKDARPFIEQQIGKDAYKLTTNEVNGGSLFSAGLNAPRWLPASCPAPKPISIKGVSTSLSFEPACQFASSLGPLFVALAGVFFAVYVGRAFGGS